MILNVRYVQVQPPHAQRVKTPISYMVQHATLHAQLNIGKKGPQPTLVETVIPYVLYAIPVVQTVRSVSQGDS